MSLFIGLKIPHNNGEMMLKQIQALPAGARMVVFLSLMIGLALAFIGIVAFLSLGAINQQNATQSRRHSRRRDGARVGRTARS